MPKTTRPKSGEAPPKPKALLHAELEEIEGAGDIEHGDLVTLQARGKVTELSTRNNYDSGGTSTSVTIELSEITVVDKDLRKSTTPTTREDELALVDELPEER